MKNAELVYDVTTFTKAAVLFDSINVFHFSCIIRHKNVL